MNEHGKQWVPKVHPLTREIEPDDPMELVATPAPGDPDEMLECLIQEFLWMGTSAEELMHLFRSPGYPVLQQLLALFGEEAIRARIETVLGDVGGVRFHAVVSDEVEAELEHEPELIPLTLRLTPKGANAR
jgi:hypothetical protein